MKHLILATVLTTALGLSQASAQLPDDTAFQQELDRRMKLCRDFDCYYRICVDLTNHAQKMVLQTLRQDPVALQAYQSQIRADETHRECTDTAQIDVWCHGDENCIVEGEMGRGWAKKEGRPMTEQDWRIARCVRQSIDRGEDAEVTRERCGRR